jgi:hypothetical protein
MRITRIKANYTNWVSGSEFQVGTLRSLSFAVPIHRGRLEERREARALAQHPVAKANGQFNYKSVS